MLNLREKLVTLACYDGLVKYKQNVILMKQFCKMSLL